MQILVKWRSLLINVVDIISEYKNWFIAVNGDGSLTCWSGRKHNLEFLFQPSDSIVNELDTTGNTTFNDLEGLKAYKGIIDNNAFRPENETEELDDVVNSLNDVIRLEPLYHNELDFECLGAILKSHKRVAFGLKSYNCATLFPEISDVVSYQRFNQANHDLISNITKIMWRTSAL